MSPELSNFLSAAAALIVAQLLQPYAAVGVGAFLGGYTIGASKNRSAVTEIARGVLVGVTTGVFIWITQQTLMAGV